MKKYIFFLSFILISISINAQLGVQIVNDPTNLAKIKEMVEAGQQQLDKIKEQTKILKDASDIIKNVNSNISALKSVKNITAQQGELISFFTKEISNAKNNSVSVDATEAYINTLNVLQENILDNTIFLTKLLSDGIFNMSDAERLKEIREIENSNAVTLGNALKAKDRFNTINEQLREMERLMNN